MGKKLELQILFSWTPKSLQTVTTSMKLRRRKAMTNLDSILKSRGITLSIKIWIVKASAFPVVMYRCETWTIKKAECQRIDPFKLWCWRRLGSESLGLQGDQNQSILKEINPEYVLEGQYWSWSSNTLATWFEEPTDWKRT